MIPPRLIGSSSSAIKSHNLRAILLTLLRQEKVSRVRLARLTGLSTTTITNLITELLEQGIVAEEGNELSAAQRGVGRPRTALRLVPQARYAVGVHIGVGRIRVAVTDLLARPIYQVGHEPLPDAAPESVLDTVAALVAQALAESNVAREMVVGVGVGASGLVDIHEGVNLIAPNLGWRNVPIRAHLTEALALPVFVDNNVRAMALGEALFGCGRDVYTLAFVYGRVGVGAGFVVGGQLYRGSGAGAGEIGHSILIADGAPPCRCGGSGCLETLVSEVAIIEQAHIVAAAHPAGPLNAALQSDGGRTIEQIFAVAREGDDATLAMLEERARYLGIALANLVNILNPDVIVLGGIFEQGADLLLPTVEQTVRTRAFADLGERVQLCVTQFGRQAGVIGAAALALDAFFYQQTESENF